MIADRWQGVSPAEVMDWTPEMIDDALDRIASESAYHKRAERRRESQQRAQAARGRSRGR